MATVLVTGASTGIGHATALHFAACGWRVLAGVRSVSAGEQLAEVGGELILPITLDVTDQAQIAAARAKVEGLGGRLDGLVNNAGIGVGGPLELVPEEDLRRQFDINVLAQIAVTRAMLPALRRAQGRIAFMSSIGGRVAMPFTSPYAASKHAIEAFADCLRVELRTSGIEVTLIEPGSVATPIWGKSQEEADRLTIPAELQREYGHVPAAMEKVLRDTANRGVPPHEVAKTIDRAFAARHMRARYLVGRDAKAMLVIKRVLPDRLFDRFAKRALGV
jgi:NAD(P)-dependent dehydrogenase (short-subunit alcohol dehydrogenase family)